MNVNFLYWYIIILEEYLLSTKKTVVFKTEDVDNNTNVGNCKFLNFCVFFYRMKNRGSLIPKQVLRQLLTSKVMTLLKKAQYPMGNFWMTAVTHIKTSSNED